MENFIFCAVKVIVAGTVILSLLSFTKSSVSLKNRNTVFLKLILHYERSWKIAAKYHYAPPTKLSMAHALSIEVNTDLTNKIFQSTALLPSFISIPY